VLFRYPGTASSGVLGKDPAESLKSMNRQHSFWENTGDYIKNLGFRETTELTKNAQMILNVYFLRYYSSRAFRTCRFKKILLIIAIHGVSFLLFFYLILQNKEVCCW